MKLLSDPRPWWGMLHGPELSIAELIANSTLSAEGAAALWWALEQGASVMVAAGPQGAGKSTLATALLAFLPEDAALYVTAGPHDSLALPPADGPIYLLVNELSNHTPWYLSGPAALRAFALLGNGVRMIGTLHADDPYEALEVLHEHARVPLHDVLRLMLIVVLRARRVGRAIERRVVEVGMVYGEPEARTVQTVLEIPAGQPGLVLSPTGLAAFAVWAGVPRDQVEADMRERAGVLRELVASGSRDPRLVHEAIRAWMQRARSGDGAA